MYLSSCSAADSAQAVQPTIETSQQGPALVKRLSKFQSTIPSPAVVARQPPMLQSAIQLTVAVVNYFL